jgi:ketosteroid isomerase-like protein
MMGFSTMVAVIALAQAEPAARSADVAPPAPTESVPGPTNPTPTSPATPNAVPAPPRPRASTPDADRADVARAALAFLDALVAGDAGALAALSSERFSFDGDVRVGRDAVRGGWRGVLATRPARAALLDLEVLPAADAVARLGPPPARVATLVARGGWVAIADVSGRAVVLFVVREGGRWSVAGMHD